MHDVPFVFYRTPSTTPPDTNRSGRTDPAEVTEATHAGIESSPKNQLAFIVSRE
jgi:hypothetical protein